MHFQQIPNSMRGGLDHQKKKKIPNLQLFPNLEGGEGVWRGWDGFPSLAGY